MLAALAGRTGPDVRGAADRLGWAAAETDWKDLVRRVDVHLVDLCTPGDSHAKTAVAALAGGKHVLYEKPLANTVAEAIAAAADAARARGVRVMLAVGTAPEPSFTDGPQVQRVLAAADSTAGSGWTPIGGS